MSIPGIPYLHYLTPPWLVRWRPRCFASVPPASAVPAAHWTRNPSGWSTRYRPGRFRSDSASQDDSRSRKWNRPSFSYCPYSVPPGWEPMLWAWVWVWREVWLWSGSRCRPWTWIHRSDSFRWPENEGLSVAVLVQMSGVEMSNGGYRTFREHSWDFHCFTVNVSAFLLTVLYNRSKNWRYSI